MSSRASRLLLLLTVPMLCHCAHRPPDASERTLQAALEEILARHPEATVAVAVRDPSTGTTFDWNADRLFHAASTMKVPVMIEVFRQAEQGQFALDDSLTVRNRFRSIVDGSPYHITDDSDDALYDRLGENLPIRALTERMVTRSSNLATNLVIERVSADSVQRTAERLGTERMQVLRGVEDIEAYRRGLNNTTTAGDLALVLQALMQGRAVSPAADRAMIALLLDQEFNTMIPAGLPPGTRAAHKTGWITQIHHDAAIVYPPEGAPYVLVILTKGIDDHDTSSRLGADIARAVHAVVRGDPPAADG